jgi:DNA modification methylase
VADIESSVVGRDLPAAHDVWTVYQRDARDTGRFLAATAEAAGLAGPFLTATITSPPYANLVDYGPPDQIGFGQDHTTYLDECEAIFADVHTWTRSDGSLWVIADTMMDPTSGSPSSVVPLPFELSERASRAGWTLRDVVIWRKDRTRPWASPGRLRNGFEYVLYFVKTNEFKHHVDRLRDIRGLKSWWVKYPERHNPWGLTPDNVWEIPIPVQGSWASNELRHACPFPEDLVRRMVELSTDPGDIVFDPFAGSGMVPAVSEFLGRVPLGTELNPDFCKVYAEWVRPTALAQDPEPLDIDSLDITKTLLSLRVLKFPKALMSQVMRSGLQRSSLLGAVVLPDELDLNPKPIPYASLDCWLIVPSSTGDGEIKAIQESVDRLTALPPLSKWGVAPRVSIVKMSDLETALQEFSRLSAYLAGRTWKAHGELEASEVAAWIEALALRGVPPILSTLHVSVELEA